ncbi:hypothetical protein LTR67_007027 [Exophiala xenobiotica]
MAEKANDTPLGQDVPYVRTVPFSDKHRLIDLPRYSLPPPDVIFRDEDGFTPTVRVGRNDFQRTSDAYGSHLLLNAMNNLLTLEMHHKMSTWVYEMRREAQAILPFLFLGPISAAKDPSFIKSAGITLMIAARSSNAVKSRPGLLDPNRIATTAGLATMTCDFEGSHDLFPQLRTTIEAINEHLLHTCCRMPIQDVSDIRGKVFIFCETGNDRAKKILADFYDLVQAEYEVSASNAAEALSTWQFDMQRNHTTLLAQPAKRGIDDVYDSDVDMEREVGGLPDRSRQGVAPFADMLD